MQYWGRLSGSIADYLVAVTWLGNSRVYYIMRTCAPLKLLRLRAADPADVAKAVRDCGRSGALLLGDGSPAEEAALAVILALIDAECSAVPAAAWTAALPGDAAAHFCGVVPAEGWTGVPPVLATALSSYTHLRAPRAPGGGSAAAAPSLHAPLDVLGTDALPGAWAVTLEPGGAAAKLRCAAWPGYLAWAATTDAGTRGGPLFGAVYHGDGRRQNDARAAAF